MGGFKQKIKCLQVCAKCADLHHIAHSQNLISIEKFYSIGLDKRGYQVNSFLISRRKHMLWCSLEVPRWGASNEYPQHMSLLRNKKNIDTFWLNKTPYQELCIVSNDSISGQWRPWSGCMDVQADLGLCCPHMPRRHFHMALPIWS